MRRKRGSGSTGSPGLVLPGESPITKAKPGTAAPGDGPDIPGFGGTADLEALDTPMVPIFDIEPADPDERKLGEILQERSLVTEEDVEDALRRQEGDPDKRIGEILMANARLDERELAKALAIQTGTGFVDLRRREASPEALKLLPEATARELVALPLESADGVLIVAVGDPTTPDLLSRLGEAAGMPVTIAAAAQGDVSRILDRSYRATGEIDEFVHAFEARVATREGAVVTPDRGDVDENAPIVQVVSRLLSQAVRDRASDVHIEPMGNRVRIRNRIDGALHEVLSLPSSMSQALVSRIKILAGMNIVERRRPQDGQLEFTVDGKELDVRVSTTSTVFGEKCVLRVLDKQRALYDLAELGMPDDTNAVYSDIIRSPWGMVACAGPTGSGKTTTLYATLSAINNDEINVMTVEDPVEYVFPTVNQIPINEQAGVTFAAGLRAILRQDPDAVLVGEIRDIETARIAVQAALTGHFVLSTIHATDAVSALHRFLDMGIESFLLASSMLAVVGQRLLRRICTECIEPYEPSAEDLAFYERMGGKPKETFMHGAGCQFCSGTGYLSRTGVYEVLKVTDEMRDLIVHNASVDEIRHRAIDQGMVPLRDQAIRLVAEDVTTIAEVVRTIYIL
jgi:type IV pilus assembly protein PilB